MTITARSGVAIRQEQRRLKVSEMRRSGSTLAQIATELDCSLRTVQRDIDSLLGDITDDRATEVEAWRAEAVDDLRHLSERLWAELDKDASAQGVAALAGTLIRGIERTAQLVGADAPTRIAVAADRAAGVDELVEIYRVLPIKAIERARGELNRQFDKAVELRAEYDALAAERIAAIRADPMPEVDKAEEPEILVPVPSPPEPPPIVPAVVPADRATARAIDRQLAASVETDAAISGFKRANSVTGLDA